MELVFVWLNIGLTVYMLVVIYAFVGIPWPRMRPFAKEICDLIDKSSCEDWDFNKFTARHLKSGLELWTTNHTPILFFFEVYGPIPKSLRLVEKIAIYRRLEKIKQQKIQKMVKG